MKLRIARIVPLIRMPRSLGFFDYLIPEGMDADIGELVTIPFRGRKLPGIVVEKPETSDVPEGRLKEIHEVIDVPPLGKAVVHTILQIAAHSLTSPATTAHAFVPTIPKRQQPPLEAPPGDVLLPEPPEDLPPLWKAAFEPGNSLLAYDDDKDRDAFLAAALHHAHTLKRPLLFIAPRTEIAKRFVKPFGDHGAFVTGQGAMTARWKAWLSSSNTSVVAGTALALFTPHTKPSVIIVDEEDASEHVRSDAAPRFDVRKAAEEIGKAWDCPVIFLSRTPSLLSWSRLGVSMRRIPALSALRTRTVTCDFGDEFRSKRFRPITEAFLVGLDAAMKEKKRAVIIMNRKGDSARLVCRDCRLTVSCKVCSLPLSVHGTTLSCPQCHHTEQTPDLCPGCHGSRLAGSGAGITRVVEFLKERYPDARVDTFTKESHAVGTLKADIILGTEYLMTHARERLVDDKAIGFVGTLSADTFLVRLSDAMTAEREFRRLRSLTLLAASHDLPAYLQTSEPELPLYAMLAMKPENWYRQELEDRKSADFHPFSSIGRIIATDANHDKLKKEAEALAAKLKHENTFTIFEVRIIRSGRRSKAWIGITFHEADASSVRACMRQALPETWGYDPAPYEPIT